MNSKMDDRQIELFRRIDEVLCYIWDPIGINDSAYARDEYSSYVPVICSAAQKKNCTNEIADCLNTIVMSSMGLQSDKAACMRAAEQIFEWSELLGFQEILLEV